MCGTVFLLLTRISIIYRLLTLMILLLTVHRNSNPHDLIVFVIAIRAFLLYNIIYKNCVPCFYRKFSVIEEGSYDRKSIWYTAFLHSWRAGIRTVVFLKGCNLRCYWCPGESQSFLPEIGFVIERCISCGRCISACPKSDGLSNCRRRRMRRLRPLRRSLLCRCAKIIRQGLHGRWNSWRSFDRPRFIR